MSETNKGKQLFTVARVFFLLIVIPLSLMAILIANGIFKLGVTVKERAVTVLDQKSQEEIKIRAINTADEVANFLNERKKDLLIATIFPATDSTFKKFVNENKKSLWIKEKDKIRQIAVPLYAEMSLIDKNGNEQIKVSSGEIVPKASLVNVGNPANTTYKNEDYFAKAKNLNKGEVYISPVTGWYVNRAEFEKGKRFSGIIRIATPFSVKRVLQASSVWPWMPGIWPVTQTILSRRRRRLFFKRMYQPEITPSWLTIEGLSFPIPMTTILRASIPMERPFLHSHRQVPRN